MILETIFYSLIPIFITFELLQIISPINFKMTDLFDKFNQVYMYWILIAFFFNFYLASWLLITSIGIRFYNVKNGYNLIHESTNDNDIRKYIRIKRMFAFWTIVLLSASLYYKFLVPVLIK
jgi:hypothetical protein